MKLVWQKIMNGVGSVKLVPEKEEDMWHVSNLVEQGDLVSGITMRKVMHKTTSRGSEAKRMQLKLEVEVETMEYDKVVSVLRVRGKNMLENEHVKLGAYHTIELDQQRPFVLTKVVWNTMAIDYLKQICNPTTSSNKVAMMMQEGLVNVCLVETNITTIKRQVKTSIPRKHEPKVKVLDDFHAMMSKDSTRAFYGPGHVFAAHDYFAIQTLLITDELFESVDINMRQKYTNLIKSVKDGGGEAFIFPITHISGEQLQQLTGIAAILRFPLPHLEDMEL